MSVFLLQVRPEAQHFLAHSESLPQAAMPPHSSPRCLVQEPALEEARGLGLGVVAGAAAEACAGDQAHAPAPFLTHSLLPSNASLKGPLPAAGEARFACQSLSRNLQIAWPTSSRTTSVHSRYAPLVPVAVCRQATHSEPQASRARPATHPR